MDTVVMDIVKIGLAAMVFIIAGKIIFNGFNIPVIKDLFNAA